MRMGHTMSKHLFESSIKQEQEKTQLNLSKILAFMVAGIVHLLTLFFAVLGIMILINNGLDFFPLLLALLCLGIAWILRPQFSKAPDNIADPDKFPTLYRITNRIAEQLGAKPVTMISVDSDFNASFRQVGWRRESAITIGLPLFAILSPQEQIAILAHEVAHGVNGDPNRGFFVGSAINTLMQWYSLLRPAYSLADDVGYSHSSSFGFFTFIANFIANIIMRILASFPWLGAYVLSHLLWHNSQRAEYFADALAAKVSSTPAMLSALEKLHYTQAFDQSVQQVCIGIDKQDIVPVLRQNIASMPAREIERIQRLETMSMARLDVTHPPTSYRIQFLQANNVTQTGLQMSDAEAAQLEQELLTCQTRVQNELIDQYRSRIYY